ncbi:MAG: hypothetical protein J7K01_00050, partial [Thermovirga sp.]|nr:hypothetical protein [Thermovirga sp.]
ARNSTLNAILITSYCDFLRKGLGISLNSLIYELFAYTSFLTTNIFVLSLIFHFPLKGYRVGFYC